MIHEFVSFWLPLALIMCASFIFGFSFDMFRQRHKAVGTFTINHSDPQVDLCRLNLEKDLDYIENCDTMVLKVVVEK